MHKLAFPFRLRHAQSFIFSVPSFNYSYFISLILIHRSYVCLIVFLSIVISYGDRFVWFGYIHFSFRMSLIESKSVVCYSKHVFVCTASFVKCSRALSYKIIQIWLSPIFSLRFILTLKAAKHQNCMHSQMFQRSVSVSVSICISWLLWNHLCTSLFNRLVIFILHSFAAKIRANTLWKPTNWNCT